VQCSAANYAFIVFTVSVLLAISLYVSLLTCLFTDRHSHLCMSLFFVFEMHLIFLSCSEHSYLCEVSVMSTLRVFHCTTFHHENSFQLAIELPFSHTHTHTNTLTLTHIYIITVNSSTLTCSHAHRHTCTITRTLSCTHSLIHSHSQLHTLTRIHKHPQR